MADAIDVQLDGVRELVKSLRAVDKTLPKQLTHIHKRVSEPVADRAQARAPRRSGKLAGSIRGYGTQRAAAVGAGARLPPYAGPIHWGWPAHHIAPNPFLTDALRDSRDVMLDVYEIELDKFIDSVWQSIN